MWLRILVWAVCTCGAWSRTLDASADLGRPLPNDLGQYEDAVTVTNEILPDIAKAFKDMVSRRSPSEDPLSPDNVLGLLSAFMPVTRKVLLATAKAEGRTVSQEELRRLQRVEEALPSAVKFLLSVQDSKLLQDVVEGTETSPSRPSTHIAASPTGLPSVLAGTSLHRHDIPSPQVPLISPGTSFSGLPGGGFMYNTHIGR